MFKAICHGLNAAKAPKAFPTHIQSRLFIPLFAGGGCIGGKRHRAEMAEATASKEEEEVVVLLDSDDEEKQQRQRIMEFAASRRIENKQQHTTLSKVTDNDNAGSGEATATATADATTITADEEEIARTRIVAQAAAINADRGISNTNNLLAQLHAERQARRGLSTAAPASSNSTETEFRLSILSYNLWFKEEVQIHSRMEAISQIISTALANDGLPDVLCFQEATPLIYNLLSRYPWWRHYTARPEPADVGYMSYFTVLLWKNKIAGSPMTGKYAAIPYENSHMGRDLKAVNLTPYNYNIPICVATSHLESPTGRQRLFSKPRQAQCQQALAVLDGMGKDSLLIGDMNWNEKNDGEPPLPAGW